MRNPKLSFYITDGTGRPWRWRTRTKLIVGRPICGDPNCSDCVVVRAVGWERNHYVVHIR